MNGQRNQARGFTLLELLMVVIIMAILASIALPQYFRVVERSRAGQVMQLLASYRGSEIRFKAQNPAELYTTAVSDLDIEPAPAMPSGWATVAVAGTGASTRITVQRVGGPNNSDLLGINLDQGTICASDASSAADWGVVNPCP